MDLQNPHLTRVAHPSSKSLPVVAMPLPLSPNIGLDLVNSTELGFIKLKAEATHNGESPRKGDKG